MLQLGQRPLSGSDADLWLFVGRDAELQRASRAVRLGFNVLILAPPGGGKTSFLGALSRRLEGTVASCVLVDGQPWDGAGEVAGAVLGELRVRRAGSRAEPGLRAVESPADYHEGRSLAGPRLAGPHAVGPPGNPSQVPGRLDAGEIEELVPGGAVVMLDSPQPQPAHTLFGRFRDELWQLPLQWIVAGDLRHRNRFLEPPADSFFEDVIVLPELTNAEATELLERRIEAARGGEEASRLSRMVPMIVERVDELTPRKILSAARAALLHEDEGQAWDRANLKQRAAALGRSHGMVFSELESLGPAHAGDERLLRRLGYTRSRVVQILKELEEEGMVGAFNEGRRRMYFVQGGE